MKSLSQAKYHGHWSGSETSTQVKIASGQYAWLSGSFPPAALGKAYEQHVGKALHSAAYLYNYTKNSLLTALVNCKARMVSCQFSMLQLVSRCVIDN